MNKPLVSIVLTTFNAIKYIDKQLNSIINQTYTNIELIILDDCSSDDTLVILDKYEKSYPFIKVIQNQTRLGVIKNFEKGISLTNGDLIALCDQDDIWIKEKIEVQVNEILKYQTPALVHTDLEVIDSFDTTTHQSFFKFKGYEFSDNKSLDILISRSGIMGNTILFNRALKDIILPFPDNIPMHDYYIGVINEIYGKRITLYKALVKYRIHESNIGNRQKGIKDKLRGFIYNDLPYSDRKIFLTELLQRDLSIEDQISIKKFLKCIEYNSYISFMKCLKKDYFKISLNYKIKLVFRFILKSHLQIQPSSSS